MIKIGIDPVIATVFGFDLRWYSLIVMLAVITVVSWAWRQARKTQATELRNNADSLISILEKTLREPGEKVPTDFRQEAESKINQLRSALAEDNIAIIRDRMQELRETAQKVVVEADMPTNPITTEAITSLAIWAIPGGIIGSRLVHVIDQLDFYLANPRAIIGGEGQAIYGAMLGAALAVWLGNKLTTKLSYGRLMDLVAPGVLLGQAVGRLANIINGDAISRTTDLPWGFAYTHPESYAYPKGVATHPTPVYEILWDLAVFGIVYKLRDRLQPPGSLFAVYLTLYSLGRFFISYVRVNSPFLVSGLNQAQVIALLVLAITIPFLAVRTRWSRGT